MELNNWIIGATAVGSFFTAVFGKEGWKYLTRSKELKAELSCKERIKKLEDEMVKERLLRVQMVTGVDLMLTMLEEEYGDDTAHKTVIEKVRSFINVTIEENKELIPAA